MAVSYVVRLAEPEDLAQMVRLWQCVGLVKSADGAKQNLAVLKREPGLILLVAESEGKVIGTVLGGTDGWWGWVYRLVVAREYRNRGIGKALVRDVEGRLKSRGVRYVNTIVSRTNAAALGVFRGTGWTPDEDHIRVTKRI